MADEIKLGRALSRSTKPLLFLEHLACGFRVISRTKRYNSVRPMLYDAGFHGAKVVAVRVGTYTYFYSVPNCVCVGWTPSENVRVTEGDVLEVEREVA